MARAEQVGGVQFLPLGQVQNDDVLRVELVQKNESENVERIEKGLPSFVPVS
jgi:hypothetical protein